MSKRRHTGDSAEIMFESLADMMIAAVAVLSILVLFFILQVADTIDARAEELSEAQVEQARKRAEAEIQAINRRLEEERLEAEEAIVATQEEIIAKAEKISQERVAEAKNQAQREIAETQRQLKESKMVAREALASVVLPNVFSGGTSRPTLFCSFMKEAIATNQDYLFGDAELSLAEMKYRGFVRGWDGDDNALLFCDLYSPSYQHSSATLDLKTNEMVSAVRGESWAGTARLDILQALELFSGIRPGTFSVDGRDHPMLVVERGRFTGVADSQLVAGDNPEGRSARRVTDCEDVIFSLVWDCFRNGQLAQRAAHEFVDARTRVYIEGEASSRAYVVVGHYRLPLLTEGDRSAYALLGLSGGSTEFVFLGTGAGSRIETLRRLGHPEAADYYEAWLIKSDLDGSDHDDWKACLPSLSDEVKLRPALERAVQESGNKDGFREGIPANELVGEFFEAAAYARWRNLRCAEIISSHGGLFRSTMKREARLSSLKEEFLLPPFLAYPEAFDAYIEAKTSEAPEIPDWVLEGLFEPLGFTRRVVREEALRVLESEDK